MSTISGRGSRSVSSGTRDALPPTRSYLITGGAGFVGSHLVERLLREGHRVAIVDDLSTGSYENIRPFVGHERFRFAVASVTDAVVLDRLASEAEVVVHLAAAVGVRLVVERPIHTLETNVKATEEVLQAALRYRAKVLIASSSEVYGKGAKLPFAEDDDLLLGPTSKSRWGYAASKVLDEFLGFAYHRERGLPVVVVRLFNTVGPRQTGRYGMVLPRFVRQSLRGEDVTVYGDGTQTRCFCDVRDVVRAIHGLSEHDAAAGRAFNVGGAEEISIQELAERVIRATGSSSRIVHVPYEQAYAPGFEDLGRRVPELSRIRELLGWRPRIPLDRTIEDVRRELAGRGLDPAS